MRKLFPAVLLLCITFLSCNHKAKQSSALAEGLKFDSISYSDSLIKKGNDIRADYSVKFDYPTQGDDSCLTWLKQWFLLEVAGQNDSLPATPRHTAQLFARLQYTFHASVDNSKQLCQGVCTKFFGDFKKEVAGIDPSIPTLCYEDGSKIKVEFAKGNMLCVRNEFMEYRGGAHPLSGTSYTIFDLKNKRTLLPNDIFKKDAKEKLTSLVAKGLYQYFKVKDFAGLKENLLLYPDTIKSLSQLPLPVTAPAFTKEGVLFVYQQYEIACYAAGMPTTVIPYKDLAECFTPAVKELLGLK